MWSLTAGRTDCLILLYDYAPDRRAYVTSKSCRAVARASVSLSRKSEFEPSVAVSTLGQIRSLCSCSLRRMTT